MFGAKWKRAADDDELGLDTWVVAGVALLFVFGVGSLFLVRSMSSRAMTPSSPTTTVTADLALLTALAKQFTAAHGHPPPTMADLLTTTPTWPALRTTRAPRVDPWGHPYQLVTDPTTGAKRFASYGSDGTPNGTGDAADVLGPDLP